MLIQQALPVLCQSERPHQRGVLIRARGSAAIGQKVFVRDDVIEGGAPSLAMFSTHGRQKDCCQSCPPAV
ncbi:hypothetical protein ELB75_03325 [Eikenella corrodens]|uniref:Uncharacterized protein n=1 Tax=Eikenella corrodens TaxID=539 RepID=A0A3S9SMH4_EIKCO|nr:hypothetical protein ELB75_03325 [Eikenella corrodens]